MKILILLFASGILSNSEGLQAQSDQQGPYIFGTSLNTKGVANGDGVGASETTTHSLGDVSQSKSYANGDKEVNARTDAQAIWLNILQGVNSNGDAVQNGKGNSLADSWSKSFTPTKEYYLAQYFKYISFLDSLYGGNIPADVKDGAVNELKKSIANFQAPNFSFNGETSFDLQQSRASGQNTSASTSSKTFNWGRQNTIQKGFGTSGADKGWASNNASDYVLSRTNYATVNKNSAAFGDNALSHADTDLYIKNQIPYQGGQAWGTSNSKDAVVYSNINANNFGYGALQGNTNSYVGNGKTTSVSDLRSAALIPQQRQAKQEKMEAQPEQGTAILQANQENQVILPGSSL